MRERGGWGVGRDGQREREMVQCRTMPNVYVNFYYISI